MKITNKYNLPDYIYKHLCASYPPKENRFSVTDLIGPPLLRNLKMKHWNELEEDASDRLWRFFGRMGHFAMEETATPDSLDEEKMVIPFDGIEVVLKPDRLVGEDIIDFKFTSVWSFIHGDKPEWENQTNLYAWGFRKHGFEVKNIFIDAILRDWSKRRAKEDNDYPSTPFNRVQIPVWTLEQQEQYLWDRLKAHRQTPPPYCTPKEMWEKPTTYAVKKRGAKRAKRVLDTMTDAQGYLDAVVSDKDRKSCEIEVRAGSRVRCEDYCPVRSVCPVYQDNKNVEVA